jgi:hypothetical protein
VPHGWAAAAEAAPSPARGTVNVASFVARATVPVERDEGNRKMLLGPVAATRPPEPGADFVTTYTAPSGPTIKPSALWLPSS